MNTLALTICEDIVFSNLNRSKIIDYINKILNNSQSEKNLEKIINLYIEYDALQDEVVYENFIVAIEYLYNKKFSKVFCTKYLILIEIEKILKKQVSYYDGFSHIENIICAYNFSDNNDYIDSYGEILNQKLSEVMHDFDLESSLCFSAYEDQDIAIEKINNRYKKSTIDDILKSIYNIEKDTLKGTE